MLPVNAKKSRRNQSPREAAGTEIFVFLRFGFLISPPSNLQNILHYLVVRQETFTHGIEKFAINQYLKQQFQIRHFCEFLQSRGQSFLDSPPGNDNVTKLSWDISSAIV